MAGYYFNLQPACSHFIKAKLILQKTNQIGTWESVIRNPCFEFRSQIFVAWSGELLSLMIWKNVSLYWSERSFITHEKRIVVKVLSMHVLLLLMKNTITYLLKGRQEKYQYPCRYDFSAPLIVWSEYLRVRRYPVEPLFNCIGWVLRS